MIRERLAPSAPGILMLLVLIAIVLFSAFAGVTSFIREDVRGGILWSLTLMVGFVMMAGLFMVNPNEGRVLQLFGAYRGTVKTPGLRWTNPFYSKHHVSLRIHNFESGKLKVNDRDGNPIEIASVVVWKVVDTAEASFEVENYEHYVTVQSEAAVRNLATRYPYDNHEEEGTSLRGSTDMIAKALKQEIQERLDKAGVRVIEARISHLAYAPEIASAMLRRQQAGAIIAARQKIVEGAVGMVDMALELLNKSDAVHLDEERKASMVSNLLVVLCGDKEAQPVVNTGTIYQ